MSNGRPRSSRPQPRRADASAQRGDVPEILPAEQITPIVEATVKVLLQRLDVNLSANAPFIPSGQNAKQLEEARPGILGDLLKMSTQEQEHQHATENRDQDAYWAAVHRSENTVRVALVGGFLTGVGLATAGAIAATTGADAAATGLGVGAAILFGGAGVGWAGRIIASVRRGGGRGEDGAEN